MASSTKKEGFFMEYYPFHYCVHLQFNLAWDTSTLALETRLDAAEDENEFF